MSDNKSSKIIKPQCPAVIILKRELRAYFTAPVAYIVTALFLIIAGILFYSVFFQIGRAHV